MMRSMIIKTGISLTAGVLIGMWLSVLGVDFPVLWGFLAFLLHYVPNVGFSITAIPAVILTLVQLISVLFFAANGDCRWSFLYKMTPRRRSNRLIRRVNHKT